MRLPLYPWTLGIFALAAGLPSLHAADKWLKLQTDDVIVYSDASPKDVTEFAVGYTAFRHVFRQLFDPKNRPPPATVLLYRRLSALQEDLPPSSFENSETVSYSTDVDGDMLLAISVDGDRDNALQQIYLFDTVWELGRSGYALPIWMSQGAGEVLSTLDVEKGKCIVGESPAGYEEAWRSGEQVHWSRFFEISTQSPEYSGKQHLGVFHAQAWALMHWVLLADGDATARFKALASNLHETGGLEAFTSTLQVTERQLDREVSHHLFYDHKRDFAFDAAGVRGRLQPVSAPEVEVHVQLANLLFATRKVAKAEAELARARTLAPDSAPVKEALARQAQSEGEPDYAIQLYREAIAAGSTSPLAYFRSAQRWLDDNRTGGSDHEGDGGPQVESALTEIRKGLGFDPGSTYGYQLLGRAFFVRAACDPTEVAELAPGIIPGEGGAWVRYYRALLYRRLNRRDKYLADMHQVLNDASASVDFRENIRRTFAADELRRTIKEVERLAKEKQFQQARNLILAQTVDADNTSAANDYAGLSHWLDENEGWNAVQVAVAARRWAEVHTTAKAFLDNFPNSRAANAARHYLARADAMTKGDEPAAAGDSAAAAPEHSDAVPESN